MVEVRDSFIGTGDVRQSIDVSESRCIYLDFTMGCEYIAPCDIMPVSSHRHGCIVSTKNIVEKKSFNKQESEILQELAERFSRSYPINSNISYTEDMSMTGLEFDRLRDYYIIDIVVEEVEYMSTEIRAEKHHLILQYIQIQGRSLSDYPQLVQDKVKSLQYSITVLKDHFPQLYETSHKKLYPYDIPYPEWVRTLHIPDADSDGEDSVSRTDANQLEAMKREMEPLKEEIIKAFEKGTCYLSPIGLQMIDGEMIITRIIREIFELP